MSTERIDTPHAMLLPATQDELARELFCRSLTNFLELQARPPLRQLYAARVEPSLRAALGRAPERRDIAQAMRQQPEQRAWFSLRTHSQKMSYRFSSEVIARQRSKLIDAANKLPSGTGTLTLDPALPIPRYVSAHDIHHMPGSYGRELCADDVTAGALFDRQMTVNRLGSQGALNDDPGVSIAAFLRERHPDFRPKRILELGCTVGHNLLPFKAAYPDAQLHGIDVSAACLRYAHARANALGVEAHFHQQNAEATQFESGSFDLVFSRILMHETSHSAVPRIFAEGARLLAPGGLAFHSDAPQFDELEPYVASLRDWDIRCNNEPFMESYYDLPVEDLLEKAGFDRASMYRAYAKSRFVEASGADPRLNRSGGRYFLIAARKPG
jgi:SAM-dependent methyltransferase